MGRGGSCPRAALPVPCPSGYTCGPRTPEPLVAKLLLPRQVSPSMAGPPRLCRSPPSPSLDQPIKLKLPGLAGLMLSLENSNHWIPTTSHYRQDGVHTATCQPSHVGQPHPGVPAAPLHPELLSFPQTRQPLPGCIQNQSFNGQLVTTSQLKSFPLYPKHLPPHWILRDGEQDKKGVSQLSRLPLLSPAIEGQAGLAALGLV